MLKMCLMCCCFQLGKDKEEEHFPLRNEQLKALQNIPENIEDSIYTALYSFTPQSIEEIGITVGDKIHVLEDVVADKHWYKVTNLNTSHTGLVPINLLGRNLESELWWFPDTTTRTMAVNLLLWEGNSVGSFLVRPCQDPLIPYALSVRTTDSEENPVVKHYKIYYENGSYFISDQIKATNLHNLINSYIVSNSTSLGLCETLTHACARVNPELYEFGCECISKIEIDHKELLLEEKHFAEGHYSCIYKAKWRGRTVAVKIPKGNQINQENFIKEVKIMKSLQHKNILKLYGVCTELDLNYIVLEYMKLGSLLEHIKETTLSHYQRIHVATQIASAMAYLESQRVVHRDLAARNVLLMDRLCVKLSDFGLSRFLASQPEYAQKTNMEVAIKWLAPESLLSSSYTIKSDVWSFAILLMEIYTNGLPPYSELKNYNNKQLYNKIISGYHMERVPDLPENIYDLMKNCWNFNPDQRPNFNRIEVFFNNYELFDGSNLYE